MSLTVYCTAALTSLLDSVSYITLILGIKFCRLKKVCGVMHFGYNNYSVVCTFYFSLDHVLLATKCKNDLNFFISNSI